MIKYSENNRIQILLMSATLLFAGVAIIYLQSLYFQPQLNALGSRLASIGKPVKVPFAFPQVAPNTQLEDEIRPILSAQPKLPSMEYEILEPLIPGTIAMSGEATKDTVITILLNDQPLGKATANALGEWMLVTIEPLPTGSHQLQVVSNFPVGSAIGSSTYLVAIEVPEEANPRETNNELATIESALPIKDIEAQTVPPETHVADATISNIITNQSLTVIKGQAMPDAKMLIYLNDIWLTETNSSSDGSWEINTLMRFKTGLNNLKLEQFSKNGQSLIKTSHVMVDRRLSIAQRPLARSANLDVASHSENVRTNAQTSNIPNIVVVQKGDTLWDIAERLYQDGTAYRSIFKANREALRNPNKIFPGQSLTLPIQRD